MIKKFSNNASSVIKEIAYCTETNNMRIIFKTGSSYIYKSVPENVFNEFITSESLGKYFGMYIKNRYIFSKMDAADFTALNEAVKFIQGKEIVPTLFNWLTGNGEKA